MRPQEMNCAGVVEAALESGYDDCLDASAEALATLWAEADVEMDATVGDHAVGADEVEDLRGKVREIASDDGDDARDDHAGGLGGIREQALELEAVISMPSLCQIGL